MTMSFDDWFKEKDPFGGNNDNDYVIWAKKFMRISYIAGQEYHQAEVDELLLVGNNLLDRIQELCCERDELQKRNDEALKFYNEAKSQHNIGMIHMALFLKGNK